MLMQYLETMLKMLDKGAFGGGGEIKLILIEEATNKKVTRRWEEGVGAVASFLDRREQNR